MMRCILENTATENMMIDMRILLAMVLVIITGGIIAILYWRGRLYRQRSLQLCKQFEMISDEYRLVYENMPVGLVVFNKEGHLLNHNPGAAFFFEVMGIAFPATFRLFSSGLLDECAPQKIADYQLIDTLIESGEFSFRIIVKAVREENGIDEHILMIVSDHTDILNERKAKERFYEIFNQAMDKASLGVAEYNLVDKKGFATNAWFEHLCIRELQDFPDVHGKLVKRDREKILRFFKHLTPDSKGFADILCMEDGDTIHWIYLTIQLLEYAPEERRIIVAELVMNVDDLIAREQELEVALRKSKESDKMKNAFIAHMSMDIRPHLSKLVALSTELTQTRNVEQKHLLMKEIEKNNAVLLQYIERIIELSKADLEKVSTL